MTTSFDISGARSDCVDYEFSWIDVCLPRVLRDTFIVDFWGLLLRTSGKPGLSISRLGYSAAENDTFVEGWSRMIFYQPVSIDLVVAVYAFGSGNNRSFRRDKFGEIVRLERSISKERERDTEEYDLGGHLIWPDGDAQLTVGAAGRVELQFEVGHCITRAEFKKRTDSIKPPG